MLYRTVDMETPMGSTLTDIRPDLSGIRVALIAPPGKSLTQAPPIGLACLAAVLKACGADARIFDFMRYSADEAALVDGLVAWAPNQIFLTSLTPNMPGAIRIATLLRQRLPGIPQGIGGVHATVLPERTLRETGVDVLVRGEGEVVLPHLVARLAAGEDPHGLPGVACMRDGRIHVPDLAPCVEDLDSLPFPDWDQVPPAAYSDFTMQLFKRRKVVCPILTTRGCPHRCTFCASIVQGHWLRSRSPKNVVDEMEYLIRRHGVEEFLFTDDNFTQDRKHAIAVCEEMIRRDLDIVWKMPVGMRLDTVDDELMSLMRRSGCYEVGFGIESGSQEILRGVRKRLDLSLVPEKLAIAKRNGIRTYGFFILGLPGETTATLDQTLGMMRAGFDSVSVSFCVPYPGSEIHEQYVREHGDPKDWSRFSHQFVFPEVSGLDEAVLRRYWHRAILRFYRSPGHMGHLLAQMSSVPLRVSLRLVREYWKAHSCAR
jgi:radical SAM superfamily enzyme YgiQ (UPF0313 family)